MTLATKSGRVIRKDGRLAAKCSCCQPTLTCNQLASQLQQSNSVEITVEAEDFGAYASGTYLGAIPECGIASGSPVCCGSYSPYGFLSGRYSLAASGSIAGGGKRYSYFYTCPCQFPFFAFTRTIELRVEIAIPETQWVLRASLQPYGTSYRSYLNACSQYTTRFSYPYNPSAFNCSERVMCNNGFTPLTEAGGDCSSISSVSKTYYCVNGKFEDSPSGSSATEALPSGVFATRDFHATDATCIGSSFPTNSVTGIANTKFGNGVVTLRNLAFM